MFGITGYGVYMPRMRLQRSAIAQSTSWFDSSLNSLAKGERTMCNWDEDPITMAVEAGQDCFSGSKQKDISALFFASTSMPFMIRQNSVLISEALGMPSNIRTMDITGSTRAGASSLLSALDSVRGTDRNAMVIGSERRKSKCGSRQEMQFGDGATAIQVGSKNVIAEVIATQSMALDFIDRYRSEGFDFDVEWEERWIRDEGYHKLVPEAVTSLLAEAGVQASDIKHFAMPLANARTAKSTAKASGINVDAVVDNCIDKCGDTGAAQVLLLIANALENAKPGDLILALGWGQGCDTVLFRCTEEVVKYQGSLGVSGNIVRGKPESNYFKYQSFNGLAKHDFGKRSEIDKVNYLSAQYRNRKLVNSFIGGKCQSCETVQIPKMPYCVNPDCKSYNTQVDFPLASSTGRIVTWTADSMTFDFSPPAYFGLVEFDDGGRLLVDFTEVNPDDFDTGTKVKMHFRVRQIDEARGFRRYFWKAKQIGE